MASSKRSRNSRRKKRQPQLLKPLHRFTKTCNQTKDKQTRSSQKLT